MLNVGLTGGIACGKSTVAKMFVARGAHLIDFDRLAHEAQEPGKPAWQQILDFFGKEILLQDGKIDRIKLGNIVFADKKKLNKLNKIVHPLVYREWHARLEKIEKKENRAIVLSDVPLLFEGKMQHLFDLSMLVLIAPEEQIRRLIKRNGVSREEAEKRLKSQMPIREKIVLADIVIDNEGNISETEKKVRQIWRELLQREKQKNK
ncbi:MAG: dephospho-CoA kinase [Deltaproteobacteria bacterium HGW-Deltaproteobacteria-7]|jgi:dephospho-CoA kinase|nr:MAG: dephospho-CoA kinase [Deltaproteobacteria bacterium HGW-Deltaproteobacteria-7]PKN53323.1 MAG: dephospho-CoA kinase [Deltaproteobacteria bacterium HGW-Deltaproteobacteria-13]